ncbi:MAG: hypothetical protein J7L53_12690 [Deltaproteobacteria bacterium]|nr:hypothetical protein [Deltaproteobacteria bacterium]
MGMRKVSVLVLLAILAVFAFGCKPRIISVSPKSPVTILVGQTQVFTVTATGGGLSYEWWLDSQQQSSTTNAYTYSPTFDDIGDHMLEVIVSNKDGQVSYVWDVYVRFFEISWEETYGGSGDDVAYSIQQTSDEGYIVAGSSNSTDITGVTNNGAKDYYVIKLDEDGNIVWHKMYGGSGDDIAYSIQQTSDEGYIVAGSSNSTDITGVTNNGAKDYYVIKLDKDGNIVWHKMYGGSNNDIARSIKETEDGGYIVGGYSSSTDIPTQTNHGLTDAYTIKLDASGNVVWQKLYGNISAEYVYSIQETTNTSGNADGYIFAGNKNGLSYYVVRLDLDGDVMWSRIYFSIAHPGPGSAREIQQTVDGGYVVTGWIQEHSGENSDTECYTIKLYPNGDKEWENLCGGSEWDKAFSIQEFDEGSGYIIVGTTESKDVPGGSGPANETYDVYISILNSESTLLRHERHGGPGATDSGHSIAKTQNASGETDGFIIAGQWGSIYHDFYIIRLSTY